MGKITLTTIAEELASKSSLDKVTADNFIHAFFETIEKGLKDDNLVKIKGLGTFKLMAVSDRDSVDVNTGERITIKGYTKVSFTPDSAMKEFVNRPFAHFEPTELNDAYAEEEILDAPSGQINEDNETRELEVDIVAVDSSEESVTCSDVQSEDSVASMTDSESTDVESQKANLQETDQEVVAVTISTDNSPSIEEHEAEETNEIVVEVPISEDSTEQAEESAKSIEETIITEENTTAETETITEKQLTELASQKERPRWLLIVLLILLSGGVYYYLSDDKSIASNNGEVVEEIGSIIVNPNLEQELGAEWNDDECTAQTAKSVVPITDAAIDMIKEEEVYASVNAEVGTLSAEVKEAQSSHEANTPVVSSSPKETNSLAVTASLAAKNLKDITIADTTDYLINGTLMTHTLQSGETIIQLARKYYGDKRLWPYIVKHNQITDFNKVGVGLAIDIPVLIAK